MKVKFSLISTILLALAINSCETPEGFPGVSDDIKDAKERGVFVKEYTVHPNPYRVNDTLEITVKEAWLEKQWIQTNRKHGTKIENSGYQLAINTNEKDINNENLTWLIGSYHDKYLRTSSCCSLIGDFDYIPGDTIDYIVQNGEFPFDNIEIPNIGRFILVKK